MDPPQPVLRDDERGAIQVFEAVLLAMLVLSTLLIVNALQRPTTAREIGGVDLGQLSADTLDILKDRTFNVSNTDYNFTDWVEALMGKDISAADRAALADELDQFLGAGSNGVLPLGTQYQVRVDNGEGHVRLLPPDLDRTPLAARAASAYVLPNWTAFSDEVPDRSVLPGQEVGFDFTSWTSLTAPSGSSTGPDGDSWLDLWSAQEPTGQRIPHNALYGAWRYTDPGTCVGGCYLEVQLPDGTSFDRPLYGVQLVVWYGA